MNLDLIDECVDWSLEIKRQIVNIPEEKIRHILKSIIDKHYRPKKRFFNVLR